MLSKRLIIGITGPTGAGKSTVTKMIEQIGYEVIDVDAVAKDTIASNKTCVEALQKEFGDDVLFDNNTNINKELLSDRAFVSKESVNKLNKITHPYVVKKLEEIINNLSDKNVVLDAAVLFESGADKFCNFTISILTPKKIRLSRIMYRDKISRERAIRRINIQPKDSFYKMKSDYVLYGNKNILSLYNDVNKIISRSIADSDVF